MSAPDKIWAQVRGASTDVISGRQQLVGGWSESECDGHTLYIRSDLKPQPVKASAHDKLGAKECATCTGTGTVEHLNEGPPHFGFQRCPDCAIDTTAIKSELGLHPDGEPICAIWATDTVTALCDEVDRLTRELEAAIARDCPLGEHCDMTLGVMVGERRAEDRMRAALNGGADD